MNNRQFKRSLKVLSDAGVIVRTIYTEELIADPDFEITDYIRPTCPDVSGVAFEFDGACCVLGNGESRFHAFEVMAGNILESHFELTERAKKRLISAMLTVGLAMVTYYD